MYAHTTEIRCALGMNVASLAPPLTYRSNEISTKNKRGAQRERNKQIEEAAQSEAVSSLALLHLGPVLPSLSPHSSHSQMRFQIFKDRTRVMHCCSYLRQVEDYDSHSTSHQQAALNSRLTASPARG